LPVTFDRRKEGIDVRDYGLTAESIFSIKSGLTMRLSQSFAIANRQEGEDRCDRP